MLRVIHAKCRIFYCTTECHYAGCHENKKEQNMFQILAHTIDSTVVEHLPRHRKVKGSSLGDKTLMKSYRPVILIHMSLLMTSGKNVMKLFLSVIYGFL
jgi:hypothetical protein